MRKQDAAPNTEQKEPGARETQATTTQAHRSDGKLWGGRFADRPTEVMEELNNCLHVDRRLWAQDIEGSLAHVAMLENQQLLSGHDSALIRKGLLRIRDEMRSGQFVFAPGVEDIHSAIELRLREHIGKVAGSLHLGRSRNDQVATDLRLWLRAQTEKLDEQIRQLQSAFLTLAERGAEWVLPGYTHLQAAQAITFGHHLLAYVEMLGRDRDRLMHARLRLNESPLGAAALAGVCLPIDRHHTARLLGFSAPMCNSVDAVSSRDFVIEFLGCAAIVAMHLSRLGEELILWASPGFSFVRISDAFSTGSSMMPQKRNPDAAELIRAKSGRVFGALTTVWTVCKALPLSYNKDLQEDKAALFDAVDTLHLCLRAATGMIQHIKPDPDAMRKAAEEGFMNATEIADWLSGNCGMPFREAHHVVGRIVQEAEKRKVALQDLDLETLRSFAPGIHADIYRVLRLEHTVSQRTSFGGTAPSRVRASIEVARRKYAC